MGKRDHFKMSMEDFAKRFPKEHAAFLEREARRRQGATSLQPTKNPAVAPKLKGQKWSLAEPTNVMWQSGKIIRLPSKTEARVAERLLERAKAEGARIYRQVRVPLLSIAPQESGVPYYLTVDFVIVFQDNHEEWVDAKTARKSPEWMRGRAAAEAWLGVRIEETDS